jgi:hypothetical protein
MYKRNQRGRAITSICLASLAFSSAPAFAENGSDWEYSLAPFYLWAKNIEGSSSMGGNAAPLDLDFRDNILENLDGAFAFHFEAKKDNLTLFAEYNYAKLDPSTRLGLGPIDVKVNIDFKDTMWELGTMYEFADTGSTQWEILGGVRYMEQEIDIILSEGPGLGLLSSKISGGDNWWHVFGGLRFTTKLSEQWSLRTRADYGYHNSDNKGIHATAFADYRFRDWGSFFAGYRYLDTDYDNGEPGAKQYSADLAQQGPVFGVNLYF